MSENGYVQNQPKNRIAEIRKVRALTQQELADAVGAHWITISKLERGRIKLTTEWLEKLARPLGVHARDLLPPPDLFETRQPKRPYEPRLKLPPLPKAIEALEKTPRRSGPIWLEISDERFDPMLQAGDKVQVIPFAELNAEQRAHIQGRLCYFEIGPKRRGLGFADSGNKAGTYDLYRPERPTVRGVKASNLFLVANISFLLARV